MPIVGAALCQARGYRRRGWIMQETLLELLDQIRRQIRRSVERHGFGQEETIRIPTLACEPCWLRSVVADLRKEVERLQKYKTDIENAVAYAMDELHDDDTQHCTCVPVLRQEIERLRAGKHDRMEEALMRAKQEVARLQRDNEGLLEQIKYWQRTYGAAQSELVGLRDKAAKGGGDG